MAPESTPKKEKKDKKRKSLAAADLEDAGAVTPVAIPPAEGTASAEAVLMEVDGEKAAKKAKKDKKEKRKSVGGEVIEGEEKVSGVVLGLGVGAGRTPGDFEEQCGADGAP
jgi:H/ACA ribonucleoprotein complex subunit 2